MPSRARITPLGAGVAQGTATRAVPVGLRLASGAGSPVPGRVLAGCASAVAGVGRALFRVFPVPHTWGREHGNAVPLVCSLFPGNIAGTPGTPFTECVSGPQGVALVLVAVHAVVPGAGSRVRGSADAGGSSSPWSSLSLRPAWFGWHSQ